jgi:hypothetical protein
MSVASLVVLICHVGVGTTVAITLVLVDDVVGVALYGSDAVHWIFKLLVFALICACVCVRARMRASERVSAVPAVRVCACMHACVCVCARARACTNECALRAACM